MKEGAWLNSSDVFLDERKRLTDENARMRAVVEAVANMDRLSPDARAFSGLPGWGTNADLVAQARAILASDSDSHNSDTAAPIQEEAPRI